MGYYINKLPDGTYLPSKGKVQHLLKIKGTSVISEPKEWVENLVCVVDNGHFEAAGYAYSSMEMKVFKRPDGRPKTWLIVPNAKELAD